jgi:hypothetical protein
LARITRAHIIAARGRKRILEDQKKVVPEKIVKLANLDPAKFPREASTRRAEAGRHVPGLPSRAEAVLAHTMGGSAAHVAEAAIRATADLAAAVTRIRH